MKKDKKATADSASPKKRASLKKSAAPKKRMFRFKRLREGSWVSLEYFKRYAWIFGAFLVAIIGLIGLRYKTKTKLTQIKELESELRLAESEKLNAKSQYMSLIRESEMMRIIRSNHLGLTFREQPPYEITLRPTASEPPTTSQYASDK